MRRQPLSVWCRRMFLAGSTVVCVLGTALGAGAQALKDVQTPEC